MTEILDMHGNTITVGSRIVDPDGPAFVVAISDPDGDVDDYGRLVGIPPTVTVRYPGGVYHATTTWNATGPWDDDRDDYTCDDLEVAT